MASHKGFRFRLGLFVFGVVLGLAASLCRADNWPGWRGPTGMGHSPAKGLPLTWGGAKQENVLWKAALIENSDKVKLDHNQSSPIVWGDRVFVTISYWPAGVGTNQYPEHHVICFRATDGKRLWDTKVPPGPWLLKDLRGGYTAPTPATDGERVYALFGSAVLAGIDFQGKLLWHKAIVPYSFDVAVGVSPVVNKGTVLVMCGEIGKDASQLLAFEGKSGALKWQRKHPQADWTHSTPALVQIKGRTQLLMAGAYELEGLDPDNGERIWWFKSAQRIGDTVTPVYANGVVYCDTGRGGSPGIAVGATGSGDVTKTHLTWSISRMPQGFGSPVASGGYLYRLLSPGTLRCYELATGKQVYAERLPGVADRCSPVATPDGRIYLASAGKSYVVQAGPKFAILGTSELGDASDGSPAVADGRLYLKGRRYLYCIGKK